METSNVVSPWLTSKEAAAYLRVAHRTILEWARTGKLTGHVLSGTQRVTWRFLQPDLDAMMTQPSAAVNRRIQ
jgi:excisionase family DNA binding protein